MRPTRNTRPMESEAPRSETRQTAPKPSAGLLAAVEEAAEVLKQGGLILYPTDTLWGIGCDATNAEAVAKIYALKRSELDCVSRILKSLYYGLECFLLILNYAVVLTLGIEYPRLCSICVFTCVTEVEVTAVNYRRVIIFCIEE